ncbi:MAG: CGNR zinc finger domain-containing protein [Candidatus Limnocylindrales bacterium]
MTHVTTAEPGPADDLLVVANTRHGPGGHYRVRALADGPDHDHLRDAADALAYLVDHHVPVPAGLPDPEALGRMATLRDLVRRIARDRAPGAAPAVPPAEQEIASALGDAGFRITSAGVVPLRDGWPGFVDGLLPGLLELRRDAARLRVCANPRCRFAFLDRSRNRSRIWCETAVCGNRIRVGRHRRRALHRSP